MLTRSLFTFAALALFAVSATAQEIPAKLAPPQERPLVGKYAAKGVQIYVCSVKGSANEWGFKAPEAELIDAQGSRSPSTMPVRPGKLPMARRSSGRF